MLCSVLSITFFYSPYIPRLPPLPPLASLNAIKPKTAVNGALAAVVEAQEMTTKAIGAEENDEDGAATRPPPKSILSDDDEYKLESAVKKARIAGNSVPQVC